MKHFKQKICILLMMCLVFGALAPVANASAEVAISPFGSKLTLDSVVLGNGESMMFAGNDGKGYLIPKGCGVGFQTIHTTAPNQTAYYTLNLYERKSTGELILYDTFNVRDWESGRMSYVYTLYVDETSYFVAEIVNYSFSPTTFQSELVLH